MRNDDKNKTDAAAVAAAAEDTKTTKKKMVGVTTTATTKTTGCGGGGTSHSTRSTTSVKTVNDYLPPLPLVMTIIACSGFTFLYAFRDVFATGRVIGGAVDDAFLVRRLFVVSQCSAAHCIALYCTTLHSSYGMLQLTNSAQIQSSPY
jgi:hypothetical protein